MELRFSPLFSGSSGNSTYIGCDDAHLLVDAGLSGSRVKQELETIGVNPSVLDGILVTHEHADHIKGIGILSRKYDLPVFATEGTWLTMGEKLGAIAPRNRRVIEPEVDFYIGSLNITPFSIPHDAAQPVGYAFRLAGARFAIATDLGCIRDSWLKYVMGADAVILESNYEPGMLMAGPYPAALKTRILGRKGHLSNQDAGEVAVELVRAGARQIVLGHLSKENNVPALALQASECALAACGIAPQIDVSVTVASRDHNSGLYCIEAEVF